MPTDISNALGTQRQFTPQPDRQYQGNYQGINPVRAVAVDTSRAQTLAANLERLNAAFQSHAVSHEKWANDTAEIKAQRITAGMTPEEIRTMNTIDAAQQAGIVDPTANRYFKAHVEKLRGQQLAVRVKQEYDAQYAMKPARSMQEEQQRYYDFVSDWKNANLTGDNAPVNFTAFNIGFNESQAMNAIKLADSWNKKKYDEDIVITMANMQSELGEIIQMSPELLKVNGAMTGAVQEIFNEGRLMGLPPQYRMKLLDDFATQLVRTGHIDSTRLEQMLDNITVQSSLDGTTTKASDLLDMQTYKTYAAEFRQQYMDKWRYDKINGFINKGEAGLTEYFQYLEDTKNNDPDSLPLVAAMYQPIVSGIKQKEAERKAEARARLASMKEANKEQMKADNTLGAINTWLNRGTKYNGRTISSLSIDKDLLNQIATPMLYQFMQEGNFEKVNRLMQMPQMNALRSDISADLSYKLDAIRPDANGTASVDSSILSLMQFTINNSNSVESLFGGEIANKAGILKSLFDMHNGDMDLTIRDFATYNSASATDKQGYNQQVRALIASTNYQAGGVLHLSEDDNFDTTTVNIWSNPDLETAVSDLATVFCIQGLSPYDALNKAGAIVSNNFIAYHDGVFPKGCASGSCYGASEEKNQIYFRRALAQYVLENSPDDGANVSMRYDRNSQTFYFTNDNTEFSSFVPLGKVRQTASDLWTAGLNSLAEQEGNSYSQEVDEINAGRADITQTTYGTYGTGLHRPV